MLASADSAGELALATASGFAVSVGLATGTGVAVSVTEAVGVGLTSGSWVSLVLGALSSESDETPHPKKS